MVTERNKSQIEEAVGHIEHSVQYANSMVEDIAWKFLVGQAILQKATEFGIQVIPKPIDLAPGEKRLYIDEMVIEIDQMQADGEGNSSEIQSNSDSLET